MARGGRALEPRKRRGAGPAPPLSLRESEGGEGRAGARRGPARRAAARGGPARGGAGRVREAAAAMSSKRRGGTRAERRPRLVTNAEVLEVLRARRALHGSSAPEERDRGIEVFFQAVDDNLSHPVCHGFGKATYDPLGPSVTPPPSEVPSAEDLKNAAPSGIEGVREFRAGLADLQDSFLHREMRLYKSEVLQLCNLRPTNVSLVKLIVPDRGELLEQEHYDKIVGLVNAKLVPATAPAGEQVMDQA